MAGTTRAPRGCAKIRQTSGGGDGSSPGDEGDCIPGGGGPGRGWPPVRRRSEVPQRGTGGSPDGDPGDNIHPNEVHLEEEDPQDHLDEDHLVSLETWDPLVHLDEDRGPPGPQGPQGPAGPQGPPGQLIGQPCVPRNQPP